MNSITNLEDFSLNEKFNMVHVLHVQANFTAHKTTTFTFEIYYICISLW